MEAYPFSTGYGTHPDAGGDADNDDLTNLEEYQLGTLPNNPDTDADGIPDGIDGDPLHPEESPPNVTIVLPTEGQVLAEGDIVDVLVDVSDDGLVTGVSFSTDVAGLFRTVNTPPYQTSFIVPSGVSSITISATASDAVPNTSTIDLQLPVSSDQLTEITGRIVDDVGDPVAGAIAHVLKRSSPMTETNGAFAISNVPTITSPVLVTATANGGSDWGQISVPPISGTMNVGDITVDALALSVTHYGVGSVPKAVHSGDFDRDGVVDLVVANEVSGNVTVLRGLGDGTFEYWATPGGLMRPWRIATADLNRDGFMDIVTASNEPLEVVEVILGAPNGAFEAPRVVEIPDTRATSLIVMDVSGDGVPDIVATTVPVGQFGGTLVRLLEGNGDASFQYGQLDTIGTGQHMGQIGEFTGDTVPDLVVATGYQAPAQLLLFAGLVSGGFVSPGTAIDVPVSQGSWIRGLSVGDLDVDNETDIAAINDVGLWNLTQSSPSTFTISEIDVSEAPASVAIGDVDLAGAPDVLTTHSGSPGADGSLRLLRGNGDGTFQTPEYVATGVSPEWIHVDDLNGDAYPDVIVVNRESNTVTVIIGLATPIAP